MNVRSTVAVVIAVFAFVAFPPSVRAQTPPPAPTSYTLSVYSSTGTLISARTVTAAQAPCTPAPPSNASNINPDAWSWQDLTCVTEARGYADAAYLANLPDGNYAGTVRGVVSAGSGLESPGAVFSRVRPVLPGPVLLLRIIQAAVVQP